MNQAIILIGLGGHSFIVTEAALDAGLKIQGYLDHTEKSLNPYELPYLGSEQNKLLLESYRDSPFHVSIGDNQLRKKIVLQLNQHEVNYAKIYHTSSIIASNAKIGYGSFCSAKTVVQPLAKIGHHCILNTGSIIEHECILGDFVHIAPGSILCGNVTVGEGTLIGAGSVIRPGIQIGKNCVIGAGSVVVRNIEDNSTVFGNPAKLKTNEA